MSYRKQVLSLYKGESSAIIKTSICLQFQFIRVDSTRKKFAIDRQAILPESCETGIHIQQGSRGEQNSILHSTRKSVYA
jgi:hypothetical protein